MKRIFIENMDLDGFGEIRSKKVIGYSILLKMKGGEERRILRYRENRNMGFLLGILNECQHQENLDEWELEPEFNAELWYQAYRVGSVGEAQFVEIRGKHKVIAPDGPAHCRDMKIDFDLGQLLQTNDAELA